MRELPAMPQKPADAVADAIARQREHLVATPRASLLNVTAMRSPKRMIVGLVDDCP